MAAFALVAASTLLLTSCGTTATVASRSLPAYEPPVAQSEWQTVRTTAYTHSESDHIAYGARNALGGPLQPASAPETPQRALKVTGVEANDAEITFALVTRTKHAAKASKKEHAKSAKASKASKLAKKAAKGGKATSVRVHPPEPPRIGSAAADWSRWPVGTTFRVLSTGQIYKVDDYGWALAGRNTIDLYMASREDMNGWGVRHEPIQVLHWGDRGASLALLAARANHKHCRRMMLELQEKHEEAAALH